MRTRQVWVLAATIAATLALAVPATAAPLHGLTAGGGLVALDSDSPATVSAPKAITGLADGQAIVGIDVRPATQQLYALATGAGDTSNGQLYVIDPVTAQATAAGPAVLDLVGTRFDIDFNPTVDRLRVISDSGQNLRLNPNDGALGATDGALNYAGETAAGVTGAAYTNSFPLSSATELLVIDAERDELALQSPPNDGVLATRGALGVDVDAIVGFDIAADGSEATALMIETGASGPSLYDIDLDSGAASNPTPVAGSGDAAVVDIAFAPLQRIIVAVESAASGANQGLYLFRQDRPGQLGPRIPISGIPGVGAERVVGIDRRPANGELTIVTYNTLNGNGRLYTLDPASGAVSDQRLIQDATGAAVLLAPAFSSHVTNGFGVDFNPAVDRLRIVSRAGLNLRVDPADGVTLVDGALNYAAGDPGDGVQPSVVAGGYTNSTQPPPAPTGTQLFGIDSDRDALVLQAPPNDGTLTTIGAGLGVDVTNVAAYDILPIAGPANLGLAALQPGTGADSRLYGVGNNSAAPGEAVAIGTLARDGAPIARTIGGMSAIDVDSVAFEAGAVRVDESANVARLTVVRSDAGGGEAGTVDFATADGSAVAGRNYSATSGTLTFAPDEQTQTISVPIGDDVVTGEIDFSVTLSSPTGGLVLGEPAATTVTIADDDAPAVPRETLYGLTESGGLVTFGSDRPGSASSPVAITDLQDGDTLVGIDVRPATGQLFALGSGTDGNGRVYVIDTLTGTATLVTSTPFPLDGDEFGFDFNPVPDRIRVVTDAGQNLRLNPNDGNLAATDGPLGFVAGDPNAGDTPNVTTAAYTNPVPQNPAPGATGRGTQLFNLEAGNDVLTLQDPPNDGGLRTRRALGVAVGDVAGFDISPRRNTAYASITPSGADRPTLYEIDIDDSEAVAAAPIGAVGETADPVVDIAVAQDLFTFAAVTATAPQQVFQFRQDRPQDRIGERPVVGLADGEAIIGIDTQFRPTSELTALTDQGRVYALDPSTGTATNPRQLSGPLDGTSFGFDFNPTVDRVRIVSDARQNLRVDPIDGAVANVDGTLTYAPGDPNAADTPGIVAAGYTNARAGATSTLLYVVDQANNRLATQNPPNDGTLNTVGGTLLAGGITPTAGLDVVPGLNTQFAALQPAGAAASGLYAVNGASFNPVGGPDQRGQAVRVGDFGAVVAALAFLPQDRVGLASAEVGVSETAGSVRLAIVRSNAGDAATRASVTVATADGTATAGVDYGALDPTVVTFEPGESVKHVTVPIASDSPTSGDRAFSVALSAPSDVSLGSPRTTTVTILDEGAVVEVPVAVPVPVGVPIPVPLPFGVLVPQPVPGPSESDGRPPVALVVARDLTLRTLRSRGVATRFSCSKACEIRVSLRFGSRTVGTRTVRLSRADRGTFRLRLTAQGKRVLGSTRARRLVLVSQVTDPQGNRVTDRSAFRATVPRR